ncbi:Mu transposase C-terminal domain-containing protein [Azonexus sp. R2A61]|uniref:Mu transposase C-terminal domain-containing protein n=1 Tax=Azonexus sp. R2A61 TaxID=2744443 RepID=UPI001F22F4CA|nr:Mu transposase C-terminal domain-containing protein [Azonexus sp. R2A61]
MNAALPKSATSVTLAEIAAAVGITKRTAERRADKEAWPFEEIAVRGGRRRLYPITGLPKAVAEAVQVAALHRSMAALPTPAAPLPAPVEAETLPALIGGPAELTGKQLDVERARERLLAFIDAFPGAMARAIDHLNAERHAGRLPAPLAWAFAHAWDKPRADNRLSRKTVHNWLTVKATRGRAAPKKVQKDLAVKPWYGLLLALRQRPQGSCITWITDEIAKQWNPAWGETPPSYHAVRRVLDGKLSAIDQLKGRYTGSQLRAHKHYQPRTSEGMYPWQEVHADGWNTHFTAPHPVTGEFVTYEVWHFHDVATRYVPPPGIGLTETYEVITAGLERCVRFGGMMAVLQTDSTKVIKNSPRFTTDPMIALSERAGFVTVHPKEVGNSQANGICENFNTAWLDKQSRELATYQGAGMDSLSLKRVKKLTEKMVKAANSGDLIERDRLKKEAERMGKGRVFMSYAEAEAWINETCERWNDKPHRSLKKIADPVTGKRRHQTPREALQEHIDAGWQPVTLKEEHLVDLFRPHVRCKVSREAVSPIGNGQRYKFDGLGAWNGQWVMAAIDPMDWRAVWVKSLDGEFLGVADLVEATGYRAKTQYEIAEEKRANAQLKRNAKKADHIIRARTGLAIPVAPSSQLVIGGRVLSPTDALFKIKTPQAVPTRADEIVIDASDVVRPLPMPPARPRSERCAAENYAEWLDLDARLQLGEAVTEADARWHRTYQLSAQYRAESKKKAAA